MGRKIQFERRSDAAAEMLAENLAALLQPPVPDPFPESEGVGESP
jgi:hypothetical protein